MLRLEGVTKSYPHSSGAITVLRDVNASIGAGEIVAILGPSGSGKSTLLALMAGLDRPTSGRISFAGREISAQSERELESFRAKQLGIVFQQFHLLTHLSAVENVALALRIRGQSGAHASAAAMLQLVGLGHRLAHYPPELSGGERQRVAIARAMVGHPPLILADEPSGNLDQQTGKEVMDLLFKIVREAGASMVLVTHNEELASRCDRKLRVSAGQLLS